MFKFSFYTCLRYILAGSVSAVPEVGTGRLVPDFDSAKQSAVWNARPGILRTKTPHGLVRTDGQCPEPGPSTGVVTFHALTLRSWAYLAREVEANLCLLMVDSWLQGLYSSWEKIVLGVWRCSKYKFHGCLILLLKKSALAGHSFYHHFIYCTYIFIPNPLSLRPCIWLLSYFPLRACSRLPWLVPACQLAATLQSTGVYSSQTILGLLLTSQRPKFIWPKLRAACAAAAIILLCK